MFAHPPVRMEEGKGQVVHHPVGMDLLVGMNLNPHAEALQAQIKVWADSAFDAHCVANVLLAVVTMIQSPALTDLCEGRPVKSH